MAAIGNSPTQQAFTPAIDYFSGNGSTTAFTLSRPVASVAQVQVTIDNVAQNPSSAYTVSANTITFTSAPLSGTNNIYVYYTSPITQVIAPGQGTVNTTSLAGGTVTTTADASINGLTVGKGGGAVSTNTAVGASALGANTTASYNTAVGYQAGYGNTTGEINTTFGYQSGRTLSTGNYNTLIGAKAGFSLTSGSSNCFIGSWGQTNGAGHDITTGAKNTIIGSYTGNQGGLDIRTLSNRVVLSDGDGNPRLYADNNGAWQSTSAIGNGTLYPAYFCRAWVWFTCSSGAILGSGNVSSVTRISSGSYRINFTTALPDATYAGTSGFSRIDATPQFVNLGFDRSTTSDRVETFVNGSFADLERLGLAYFR